MRKPFRREYNHGQMLISTFTSLLMSEYQCDTSPVANVRLLLLLLRLNRILPVNIVAQTSYAVISKEPFRKRTLSITVDSICLGNPKIPLTLGRHSLSKWRRSPLVSITRKIRMTVYVYSGLVFLRFRGNKIHSEFQSEMIDPCFILCHIPIPRTKVLLPLVSMAIVSDIVESPEHYT